MSIVRTFRRFRPGVREDDLAWLTAEISESETEDGTYSVIDTFALDPVDTDPEHPMFRSFTTANATFEKGWYIVTYYDVNGDQQSTDPVQVSESSGLYYTTPEHVRAWLGVDEDKLSNTALIRPIMMAQLDIDEASGSWAPYEDTGLKFASDEEDVLTDIQIELLDKATCAQVEYRLTVGDDFMVKDQYDSVSGPDYSSTGQLRKVGGMAYSLLHRGGFLRLNGSVAHHGFHTIRPRRDLFGDQRVVGNVF